MAASAGMSPITTISAAIGIEEVWLPSLTRDGEEKDDSAVA
jgi:hypothetical protein